jgi:hypothetical protein
LRVKRHGRPTAAALAIGLAALAAPSAASAEAVPDASCTSSPAGSIGQPGNNRAAQTFTAQHTGPLTRAQVEIDKIGSPGDWTLSINAVDASVPSGVGTLAGDFAPPVAVTAGQQYALVFTRPASDTLRIRYSVVNACPGDAFFSFSQTDPFDYICVNPNVCDLVFAVFVEQPSGPGPGQQQTPSAKKKCKKKRKHHAAASAKKHCKKKKHR